MKIHIGKLGIEHDRNYGSELKTGWSFLWDRSYRVELERFFLVGLFKFIRSLLRR